MTKSSEKNTSENTKSKQNKNLDLNKKVADLEVQLNEQKEITKQAQYSYVNLKMDFERLLIQSQEKEKNMELDSLIKIVKKFIPFVENLRKSLDIIPEKNKQESMAQ
jgi:molecular chaperone GrpE (heat shock protein)